MEFIFYQEKQTSESLLEGPRFYKNPSSSAYDVPLSPIGPQPYSLIRISISTE